ncbi:helix-turn-helix domain-containing protein [Bradyrhizobium sp. CW1]|uniref:helix-turn-helix domain-containing protein n=1 Tax=Bradyrhizobium sp. CW1 TaxID=2782686 RepID=UPI001FFF12FB|nr:helix-turn-helix domain-containing protein [Bradyrhizobium sp. CW1]UPJ27077.1 helix-turn-helix domain-containing protein [Bradyrhizobium sp. CW1]
MSWQATAWAAKQITGSASNKLTLLALANYADDKGICWPTQETLANDTEQSIDTVQRRIKSLVNLGLVHVETRPGGRGRWDGRRYHLVGVAEMSKPQSAVRSRPASDLSAEPHHAAPGPATIPHQARSPYRTAVRHITSKEPPLEPSARKTANSADERLQAFQANREPTEVIQNRIAQRLGSEGWLILGELSDAQRARLTTLQRRGELDDAALTAFAASVRLARAPP